MTAQTFTPGPWRWTKAYETQDGRETWTLVSDAYSYGILSCDGLGNSPQGLNDFGNAHLIASAPDMFEVLLCEQALDAPQGEGWSVLERYGWDSSARFDLSATEFVRRLRQAAIAKARGEVK